MRTLAFFLLVALSGILGGSAWAQPAAPERPRDDEFIRVAPDQWGFEGADTHRRFIPLGSNLVLTTKEDLDMFGPRYEEARYDGILAACEGVNITLLKVFLQLSSVLPDPQTPGEVHITPGYFENLENFLGLCKKHHLRAEVSLACWGGNGCQWWQDGGQYFGRKPWKTGAGIDSLDILCRFWTALATRFRDNPAIFSYSPCVEWSLPNTNLTWFAPNGYSPTVQSDVGRWYWRAWLKAKYGSIDKLNAAWGTALPGFDDITLADYAYDGARKCYADPEQKIFDYSNFREWTTNRYFRPQLAAIRAASPRHLTTISNHMRFWDLWEGGAQHFLGATPFEQKPFVDYLTLHENFSESENVPNRTDADILHTVEVLARFCAVGKPMPIILEEFSYSARDPKRVADMQAAIVRTTKGHLSGWTTWYLQYPSNPVIGADATTDRAIETSWLDADLKPTPWGLAAKQIFEEFSMADLGRIPPKEIVPLDRRQSLVPKEAATVLRHRQQYDAFPHPIDYTAPHEADLDLRLDGE